MRREVLDSIDFTKLPNLKKISGLKGYTQHQINRISESTSIEELNVVFKKPMGLKGFISKGIDSIPACICNNKKLKKLKLITVKDIPECIKDMNIKYLYCSPLVKFKNRRKGRSVRLNKALDRLVRKKIGDTTKVNYGDGQTIFSNLYPLEIKALDTLFYKTLRADSIPPNIKALKNLRYLKIDGEMRSIPEEINELTNLEVLEIEGSTRGVDNPVCKMPSNFKGLQKLKVFSMHDYIVEGFPPLYDAKNLEHILITQVEGIDSIPDAIGSLQKLETFGYSEDGYKDFKNQKRLDSISNAILELERLKRKLNIDKAKVKGYKYSYEIDKDIRKLKDIKDKVDWKIHKTLEQFIAETDSATLVETLNYKDGFYQPYIVYFGSSPLPYVSSKPSLTYLSPKIGELKNLTYFSLNNVALTSLPESLGNLNKLKNFSVTNSHLKSLPQSIGNLNPAIINLSNNQLTNLPKVTPNGKFYHANLIGNNRLQIDQKNMFQGTNSENCDYTIDLNSESYKEIKKAQEEYLEYKLFGRNKEYIRKYKLD